MAAILPDIPYSRFEFELLRFVSNSRSHGGLLNIVEYGYPIWQAHITTGFLNYSDGAAFDAWFQSLRGGLKPVEVKSPHYCTPRAHIHNRGAETQAGTISAITDNNKVTIDSVHGGLTLSMGDFVSFEQAGKYAAARVVVASGSGLSRMIEIEPPLPSSINTGAHVYFDRIQLLMRPVWSSYEPWRRDKKTISFKMVETRQ